MLHGLTVTIITVVIMGYSWVVTTIMAIMAAFECEWEIWVIRDIYGRVVTVITAVIIVAGQTEMITAFMILVTAIIRRHGLAVIAFMVMMLLIGLWC